MWRKGNLCALIVGMQTGVVTVESSVELPKKKKKELPYDLVTPLLEIYLKELKPLIQKNMCTFMSIEALFKIIAKLWKQFKCPSVNEWIKNYGTALPQEAYTPLQTCL